MKFNLIDEPWLPVTMKDGTRQMLGIRDVLRKAKEIRGLTHSSPMVISALERMLLAVLYRALNGPQSLDDAMDLAEQGLDHAVIDAYLTKMHDRFWLFHETNPFFQIPWMESAKKDDLKPWLVMALERNSANSKVLFDHTMFTPESAGAITYAKAAQYLVGIQAYVPSKGKSSIGHTLNSPAVGALVASPVGEDLEKSLILSLAPQSAETFALDLAVWEQDVPMLKRLTKASSKNGRTTCLGYAHLYTWRSRAIKLIDNSDGTITNVLLASGDGFDAENDTQAFMDPMGVYVASKKYGKAHARLKDRGVWRGFDSLLPDADKISPRVIEHALSLSRGRFGCGWPFSIQVAVCQFDPPLPNVILWRSERFAVPREVDSSPAARSQMHELLELAEEGARRLEDLCRDYARHILSHGDRKVLADDTKKFIHSLPFLRAYWSNLEREFHQALSDMSCDRTFDQARLGWMECVLEEYRQALKGLERKAAQGGGWAIRAYALATSGKPKKTPAYLSFLLDLREQISQCTV